MKKCHGRQSRHRAAGHAPNDHWYCAKKKRIWPTVAVGGTGKYAPLVACLFLHDAEAFACPWPDMDVVESRACLVDHVGTVLSCAGAVQQ